METDLIKDYITSFQEKKMPSMVPRELKIAKMKGKAITIIGPRRAGKTYFFFNLIKELERNKVLYLDFEELFLKDLKGKDLLRIVLEIFPEIVGNQPEHIFLDEIQNVKNWEGLVRTLLGRGFNVYITGSSSKLLSREIATQLRGRTLSYLLLPFNFREFLLANRRKYNLNTLLDRGKVKRDLTEYLRFGGFPEIVMGGNKEKLIKEYSELAFFKDFIERHSLRSLTLARYLFENILQNYSNEISIRALGRKAHSSGLHFDIMTLYKYVESLEDTLIFFFLKKLSEKAHVRETWPRKLYLCDTGLTLKLKFSQDKGKLMENVVFLELLRKINERPLVDLYYWKDINREK